MEYELSIRDYIAIVKRRIWFFLIPFILLAALGVSVVILLPPMYQATGKILVESQQIPTDLIRSTVTGFAAERIQVIRQRVMTRANLLRVIDKFDLFPSSQGSASSSEQVDLMRSRISLDLEQSRAARRGAESTIAFNLTYEDGDPKRALDVANELVTLFLDENVRTRTARASETTDFLSDQAREMREGLESLETQIADYKQANSGTLPEQLSMNLSMLERSEQDLKRTQAERGALEEELRFLRIELAAARTGMSTGGQSSSSRSPVEQLAAAKAELLNLQTRYSESHPDVEAVRQRIETLESNIEPESDVQGLETKLTGARARLAALIANYPNGDPQIKAARADVSRLEGELETARAKAGEAPAVSEFDLATARLDGQVAATLARMEVLDQRKGELERRIADYQGRVMQTPQTERGLTALSRDYENSLRKYDEIRSKETQAQISERLEEGKKAERFLLIEPPILPEEPTKPNRKKLMAFAVVGAGGFGFACLVLAEMLFGGITSPSVLSQIMGKPPLAIIPTIKTQREIMRRRKQIYIASAAAPAALVIALVSIHFLYMPLDIVMMKVTSRF